MRKLVSTFVIGLFFVAFTNAQNTNTEKSTSKNTIETEKKLDSLEKPHKLQQNKENVLEKVNDLEKNKNDSNEKANEGDKKAIEPNKDLKTIKRRVSKNS